MTTTVDRICGLTADQRDTLAEQFDRAARITGAEPVAVVGIGCRFPGGGDGPENYWRFLASGGDAVAEVPPDRWDAEALYDEDPSAPGRMPSKWGAFLPDIAGFDADFFGISPREAESMDPQQRILLEVAWEALEHAGLAPDRLGGTRASVTMGVYYTEYQNTSTTDPESIDAYSATGNAHSVTVGRIAYLLGLRGPAVAVDTACSSSLVSVHLACQGLRMRESDLALAGGVSLILRPETQLALAKWGMLSPRGRCHAFDAGADGFVRGEGAGVVVLKRLTDAVRDGDRVLAVVRGSAVNQDGRSNGLTAPNAVAQRDVIGRALAAADIAPASVSLVETHGTGTSLGDPIEFDALAAVYGRGEQPCALGAVKTNMGHLEAAAGIAGFIKTVLALQKASIPPNLHFGQWNPAIDPVATRLFVPTGEAMPWPVSATPRRAAVSSFGLSGTNAHIVLEQGPAVVVRPDAHPPAVATLLLSGKTAQRVRSAAATLADWMAGDGAGVPLADIAGTLERHHSRHHTVAAVCARDTAEATANLRALAANRPASGVVAPHDPTQLTGIVFVYSGQGAQWPGMGQQLLAEEPAFSAAIDELDPAFTELAGFSLRQVLASGDPVTGIARIQPVLVGMQLALTRLWRSYGVEPAAVIGHSMGEVTAAVVAGALTSAQGLRVITTRSQLMSRLSGQGAMALLELDASAVETLIADRPQVTVAVYAAPSQVVIAGPPDQVDELITVVERQGRLARRIEVDVASHHPTIDPILPELRAALADLAPVFPTIPVLHTTGNVAAGTVFDADYWAANVRTPVRFSAAVRAAAADHHIFVEISPHPLLTHAIADTVGPHARVCATMQRDQPATLTFHTSLAAVRPPGSGSGAGGSWRLADLPPTPWQHSRHWLADRSAPRSTHGGHPLLGHHVELPSGEGHVWQGDVGTDAHPWLADHRVHGQPVLPAAGFAEMALAAACAALKPPPAGVVVTRLEIEQMLAVEPGTPVTTRLTADTDGTHRVEIHSRAAAGPWTRHAVARIQRAHNHIRSAPPRGGAHPGSALAPGEFYSALTRTGAQHGPAFAALTGITRVPGSWAESEIVVPAQASPHREFVVHPVLLDAALQTLAAAMPVESPSLADDVAYLPIALENLRVTGGVGRRPRCRADLVHIDDDGDVMGRVVVTDEAGTAVVELAGVYLRRVQRRTVPLPLSQKTFETVWHHVEAPVSVPATAGSWLVLAAGGAVTAQEFANRFTSPTRRVLTADLHDDAAVAAAFMDAAADPGLPPVGVVVFADADPRDPEDPSAAPGAACGVIRSVAAAVRTIVGGWHGSSPRLWLVTRNGLAIGAERGKPAAGSLRGLIRVLAYEHPDLRATLLDLDADTDLAEVLDAETSCATTDDVVSRRGSVRSVERLARAALPARRTAPVVRADASYIVTGGLGGAGMAVARWLADRGAGRLVLNGRSAPSDQLRQGLAELSADCDIAVVRGDIAAPGVAEDLVAAAESTGRSLRGVIHGAAVLDDQLVVALTEQSLQRVWAPKAAGALRLHQATVGHDLDWWVGFSSVASLFGSPGQAAYACANAWLDALVDWRRAAGLPATAIHWGQWSDVGLARELSLGALDPITPAEAVEALETVLAAEGGRIGVARLRLDRAAVAFPEIHRLGYFTDLVAELEDADTDWAGPDALAAMTPDEADRTVIARLRSRISAIMGYPGESAIATDEPLTALGLDSLMAVRIRNTVHGDFGVEPPVALLLRGATLADLAVELLRELHPGDGAEPANPIRARVDQRAAARQRAAMRRKIGQPT